VRVAQGQCRRLTFDHTTLFEEDVTNIANSAGQKIAPLILRPKQDQIDEALANFRDQSGKLIESSPTSSMCSRTTSFISQCRPGGSGFGRDLPR
jgi:hypothetical protein